METLVVVTHAGDWSLEVPGVRVVTAKSYLSDPEFSRLRRAKVFNLCRHYRYQTFGYYVSLLAEARGHKAIPTVMTMQDLRSNALVRMASGELEDVITKNLAGIPGDRFTLDIYFGQTPSAGRERLAARLFRFFPAPLLRATFSRNAQWELHNVTALSTSAIPDEHNDFALAAGSAFFARRLRSTERRTPARYDLAILFDPSDPIAPSDARALEEFVSAAESMEMSAEIIGPEDSGRLLEFDALFIRTTTAVNHFTYRFAQRAAAEGLVVIDDPLSILRCTNKVYLAELLSRHGVSTPRTLILGRDDLTRVGAEIGFPCILKKPDSSSSLGVVMVEDEADLRVQSSQLFAASDLLIAQEFMPTSFDWRVGVLNREPLFAAKYFMAKDHWQIIRRDPVSGQVRYGGGVVLPLEEMPRQGLDLAVQAANLVGDGLYGVDLKQVGDRWVVIEVNDNPSIDYEVEDGILKGELYRRVMTVFLSRIEALKNARTPR